ncbi:hypothetical protein SAMN05444339_11915 [Loktanella atrilutea]|uniref:Uncharacterized protein n=1 Tax=Loktanella atrilutea TaxID=366533 RepID=A0A1M5FCP4_LOKAT|nr:hypothetical protein [Loktanella atrilutea]SHF89188.1 hypothetical protein SAMN05444339_11915 [Loktanella atrilutea]
MIDAAPIRTAVYGNDAYRKARHGDASLVEAAAEVMQQDYQSARGGAPDHDQAVVSAEVIRQVRDCIGRNGGATDRIDEERRAYLDDLAPAERAILTHASGNQIVEHLYRHTPIDGVRPFAGRGNTMMI